jgi:hypothetical protein
MRLLSTWRGRAALVSVATVLGSLLAISPASATVTATYYVGSTSDATPAVTQLTCESPANTSCTLRAAIGYANTDGDGASDVINVTTTKTITLEKGNGPLEVESIGTLQIAGLGASKTTISGGHQTEVFEVSDQVALTITHMTIEDGYQATDVGGGIDSEGSLTLDGVNFTGNDSFDDGAAVFADGDLTVNGGTYSNNDSFDNCGAIYADGDDATITKVTVSENSTDCGGGIEFDADSAVLSDSLIAGNHSRDYDNGGGVWIDGGSATLVNNTIVGNASLGYGGGVAIQTSGDVTLQNNTIVENDALFGGGGVAITLDNDKSVDLVGNLIADNTQYAGAYGSLSECLTYADVLATSYNVVGAGGDAGCEFNGPGDQASANTRILFPGNLGAHGGPTDTFLLAPGNPALGAEAASSCPATDQRGVVRPAAGAGAPCDAGAVEMSLAKATMTCADLSGKLTTTITFTGCTPSKKGAYATATGAGFALTGGTTRLKWHSSKETTTIALGGLAPGTNACSGGALEYKVNGQVASATAPPTPALTKVSFKICVAGSGAVSLLRGTTASL